MLTDKEAEAIRRAMAAGMRGPVLVKWCELLLADWDERRARERARLHPWLSLEKFGASQPIPGVR
jgi:hypothetical protein